MLRGDLVGHHLANRPFAEEAAAWPRPLGEQHPAERELVVGRRDETAGARGERWRSSELPVRLVGDLQAPVLDVGVNRGEAVALVDRHVEAGVDHAERLQQTFGHQVDERHPGRACEQNAEHVVGGVVGPTVPRLVHQRDPHDPPHPFVRRRDPAHVHRRLAQLLHEQGHDHGLEGGEPVAGRRREQVAGGDGARAWPRVVEVAVESPQHARLGDLGQQVFDGDGRDEGFGDLAC